MCGIADIHVKKTPAVKDRTDPWWTCAPCFPPSDSVGPSGKRLQLSLVGVVVGGGRRSEREGESWAARRRSQISQWLHGVMHNWSAAMDCNPRPLFLILHLFLCCCAPAFPIIYPPNEGKRTLTPRTCVLHARARRAGSARTLVEWCASALFALGAVQIFNDTLVWSARWGQQSWEWTQTRGTWLPTAGLPSAPDNSCLNEDEWIEQWRDRSRSAHRRVDGGRVEPRRQLWCLLRL